MNNPMVESHIALRLNADEYAQFLQMRKDGAGAGYGMVAEKIRASHTFSFLVDIGVFEYSKAHKDWYWWNRRIPHHIIEYGTHALLYILLTEEEPL